MNLTIGYLYGDLMNIYGDTGNIICLQKRCQWRGIDIKVKNKSTKDKLQKGEIDLYFFGGGQDQNQIVVAHHLISNFKFQISNDVERGVPLLSICGGYQLLGEYYAPFEGPKLEGVGIFPAYTKASHDRMIGNIMVEVKGNQETRELEKHKPNYLIAQLPNQLLIGFENHSGKTYLKSGAKPLGKVIQGFGNNGEDQTEGCIYKNAIGCYMHGSLLPKNPKLADWLIKKALEIKYGKEFELEPINDELESQAHNFAFRKFS